MHFATALLVQNNTFSETVNGVSFTMVQVKGGTFTMGCTAKQRRDCDPDESPAHRVRLSDYSMGEAEVTQVLWRAVMGSDPSHKLNGLTGKFYRLPTKAEWEYAARGENKCRGYQYSGSNDIGEVAWYGNNSDNKTHAVKGKKTNELGLYDMSGNVYEWCSDGYDAYSTYSQTNPTGPATGAYRVIRGGSWRYSSEYWRVSFRSSYSPDFRYLNFGFRLASQ
jgi:formylglycine-generating enzyme required for sulfatase activity